MIAREVDKGVEDRFLLARGGDMISRPYFDEQNSQPMRKLLGEAMQRAARELVIQLKELNDALHSQAALLSAHANQRL